MARMRKSAVAFRAPEADAEARTAMAPPTFEERYFSVEPATLFERRAPLEIELGAGKGAFVIDYARQHPEANFLAVELAGSVVRMLALAVARSGVTNVKVLRADARTLINLLLPDRSVRTYHVYFPDPWPKDRHVKHRLLSPHLVENITRTLEGRGCVHVATDVHDWAEQLFAMLECGGLSRMSDRPPGADNSNFGRKYAAAGRPVYAASFVKIQ